MTLEGYGVLFGEFRGLMCISIQKGIAVWRSASKAGPDVSLSGLLDVQSAYLVVLSSVDGLVNLIKVLAQSWLGVVGQDEHSDASIGEVLLEGHLLIGGDE